MNTTRVLIQGFGCLLTPYRWYWERALAQPQMVQAALQRRLCDRLRQTPYGQFYGVRSPADWARLPIVDYDTLQQWVQTHAPGLTGWQALTPEPIQFYELTSGSRGPAKRIPYTRSLLASFNRLFCLWAQDLIQHGPNFQTGQVYLCISPQLGQTEAVATTGLANDTAYLDPWLQWLLGRFLVIPPGLNRLRTAAAFHQALAVTLLTRPDLEIFSIWSPTFLTAHLAYIAQERSTLLTTLGDRLSPARQYLLAQDPIPWSQLWPDLKLISCWDSGYAADGAAQLRSLFPEVWVQGKGLIATEAPITLPLIAAQGYVPLLTEVFFEFEDETGNILDLSALQIGQIYTLILSQGAGLYRYRLGDRVRVSHFYSQTPCLEFLGRAATTVDLVGEKLTLDFVKAALEAIAIDPTTFRMVVPTRDPEPHYVLLLNQAATDAAAIAAQLEQYLHQSPQYRQARLLGQLGPIAVYISPALPDRITAYHLAQGKLWGNLKYPLLDPTPYPITLWADL